MYDTSFASNAESEKIDSEAVHECHIQGRVEMDLKQTVFGVCGRQWWLLVHFEIHGGTITNLVIDIIQAPITDMSLIPLL